MKQGFLGLLAVGLLAAPMVSNAVPVTWRIAGQIVAGTSDTSYFPPVVAGDPFEVLLSFDTDAALIRTQSGGSFEPGVRYSYDPASIQLSVRVGGSGPVNFAYGPEFPQSALRLLDNTGYVSEGVPWDGFIFQLEGGGLYVFLTMRGGILDIVNGPGLPMTPDPRLADLDETLFRFQYAQGELLEEIRGEITSVRFVPTPVPEPGSLTLLGLGLAGIGLSRRRKAA